MSPNTEMPESEVKVKISRCPKCKQPVRMAVSHMMDEEEKKEFYDEARNMT